MLAAVGPTSVQAATPIPRQRDLQSSAESKLKNRSRLKIALLLFEALVVFVAKSESFPAGLSIYDT